MDAAVSARWTQPVREASNRKVRRREKEMWKR
jgi:hypothetical protein